MLAVILLVARFYALVYAATRILDGRHVASALPLRGSVHVCVSVCYSVCWCVRLHFMLLILSPPAAH